MKIKLYYIGADFILSGSTFVMLDLLNNLNREKYEVYYFAKSPRNFEEFGLSQDVKIIPLYKLRNSTWSRGVIFKFRGWLRIVREIRRNADVLMVDHRNIIAPLLKIRKFIKFKCKFIIRWGNIPAYTLAHNSKEHKFFEQNLKYIDRIILPSNLSRILFRDFFKCPEHKLKTVYNTLNTRRFSEPPLSWNERISRMDSSKSINLLYVGLMIPRKDPLCLLRAAEKLSQLVPEKAIHINFVGDGELFNQIQDEISKSMLSENIKLHRAISDLSGLFNQSDIFVHTSHFDGFGIIISEAIYYNLPVIYANAEVGAIELLKKHHLGIAYRKGDCDELAARLAECRQKCAEIADVDERTRSYLNNVSVEKFVEGYQAEFERPD